MANASWEIEEPDQEMASSLGDADLPHMVLEIPRDASVEQARAAAEEAIKQMSERGGTEWIVNMKLAAFAAVVSAKLGEEQAWKLYLEVRSKMPAPKRFMDGRKERALPRPPPPPPAGGLPQPPPAPAGAPLASRDDVAPTTNTSHDAADSSWAIVPCQQEGMSQKLEETYWWQVKKGPAGKRRWGWMGDNVNERLEEAFRAGHDEVTADIDGWTYSYDLVAMMQTSPFEAATRREIRRVICDGDSDEGYSLRCVAVGSD